MEEAVQLSQSQWRTALEIKAKVVRTLRSKSIYRQAVSLFEDVPELPYSAQTIASAYLSAQVNAVLNADPIVVEEIVADSILGFKRDADMFVQMWLSKTLLELRAPKGSWDIPVNPGLIVFPGNYWISEEAHPNSRVYVIQAISYRIRPAPDKRNLYMVEPAVYLEPTLSGLAPTNMTLSDNLAVMFLTPLLSTRSVGDYLASEKLRIDRLRAESPAANLHTLSQDAFVIPFLLKLWEYMRQRIEATYRPPVTKQIVKTAKKLNVRPGVQIIRWRKEEPVPQTHPADSNSEGREYQYQWDVRPHTRTYRRGTPEEFTIHIKGYRKGPADKPYKAPNVVVNIVDR